MLNVVPLYNLLIRHGTDAEQSILTDETPARLDDAERWLLDLGFGYSAQGCAVVYVTADDGRHIAFTATRADGFRAHVRIAPAESEVMA